MINETFSVRWAVKGGADGNDLSQQAKLLVLFHSWSR